VVESSTHKRCLEALLALRAAEARIDEARDDGASPSAAAVAVAERNPVETKRAQLQLLAAGDEVRAAFAAIPELLLPIGLEGHPDDPRAWSGRSTTVVAGDRKTWTVSDLFPPGAAQVVMSALREAHDEGVSIGKEAELELPQGPVWLSISAFRKRRERDGEPRCVVVLRDITARQQKEEHRKQVFRFFELSTEPMCIADPYGCFKLVNPAFAALTGFSQAELVSKPFLEFVVPEDRERTSEEMRMQVAARPSMHFENRYRCKDGRVVALSWTAYYDETDGVAYATARDMTDRKRREDEYHTIIQASIDGFWVTDLSGHILDVNESVCRILGYSRAELLDLCIADIEADESQEQIEARIRETIRTGAGLFRGHQRRKDRTVIDVEVSVVAVPTIDNRLFVFIRDISERAQAEASLQQARNLLDDVERLSKLGGWRYEVAVGRFVLTDEVYRIFGVGKDYDLSDLAKILLFYHPDDLPRVTDAFAAAAEHGESCDLEVRLVRQDGECIWVRITGTAMVENGNVVSVTGNIADITEHKQMQEALRQSEQRLQTIFDTEPECVKVVARDGHVLEMNATGIAMLEASSLAEVQEHTLLGFVLPEYRAAFTALHESVMTGRSGTLEFEMEGKRGGRRWMETHAAPMRDASGEVTMLLGISRDITERKRAEQERHLVEAQLRESQKMEALGALAGGVAHDFNNIIASIMGNVELARQDVGPSHPARESLEEISKASQRARDLVRQILTFGRRQVSSCELVSLVPVVEEASRLLRTTLPAGVGLNVECADDVPAVLADATQIEQVILNLCSNSWQAIKGLDRPGLIEVRLEAHEQRVAQQGDAGTAHRDVDLAPGFYACLTVRDNGAGMDAETQSRIFEPFFTTKPVGQGTGLGLAVVHGIVHDHGASVEVYSEPGHGTTFRVYFPAAQDQGPVLAAPVEAGAPRRRAAMPVRDDRPVLAAPVEAGAPATHGHGKHVLFVDDDEAIVFLMKRLLARQGYRVSAYTSPREAIEAARAAPALFDLAVTDYNMPRMSGLDVARALRKIRADLPIAVASGYITEELRALAPAAGVSELIYKPNTVEDLCAVVARLARQAPRN